MMQYDKEENNVIFQYNEIFDDDQLHFKYAIPKTISKDFSEIKFNSTLNFVKD